MKIFYMITAIAFVVLGTILALTTMNLYNNEIDLRTKYEQKIDQRKSFFDMMYKTINQKTQIAIKNDESFRQNIEIIMSAREDSENVFMKWITETNPNANYVEVASIYRDLSRAVEAKREEFLMEEKQLQDITAEHKRLLRKFPNGFILRLFFNIEEFEYKPISSDYTDNVFKTNKENNIELF